MEKLLNVLFIPKCIFCHASGSFFCEKCLSSCKKFPLKILSLKRSQNLIIKFIFVYEYERFIRDCIRKAKYRNRQFAALIELSKRIAVEVMSLIKANLKNDKVILVPIPVSKSKLRTRGFNQAELIANIVSKQWKIPLKTDLLIRTKETSSQFTNNRRDRFENMRDAFSLNAKKIPVDLQNVSVILVDDICTTGATFLEASKTFYTAGVKDILCFSIARKSLNVVKNDV